jgi:hypothetical protein
MIILPLLIHFISDAHHEEDIRNHDRLWEGKQKIRLS